MCHLRWGSCPKQQLHALHTYTAIGSFTDCNPGDWRTDVDAFVTHMFNAQGIDRECCRRLHCVSVSGWHWPKFLKSSTLLNVFNRSYVQNVRTLQSSQDGLGHTCDLIVARVDPVCDFLLPFRLLFLRICVFANQVVLYTMYSWHLGSNSQICTPHASFDTAVASNLPCLVKPM